MELHEHTETREKSSFLGYLKIDGINPALDARRKTVKNSYQYFIMAPCPIPLTDLDTVLKYNHSIGIL